MKPEDTPIPTLNEKLISIEMDDVNKSKSNPPVSNS